ncbi:MAG: metallophosphoesterase [Anaerolineales bacterium]|nr:metallophosphoesterase [Anaerolineales bacterium]
MNKKIFNRRDFLKLTGLTALGAVSACTSSKLLDTATPTMQPTQATLPTATTQPTETPQPEKKKNRVLRIAHMTDFHVQPEGIAPDGMIRALRHAQSQADPPDIIFNTGDSIMDALKTDKARAEAQWEVFNGILQAECRIPIVHAIGNHDVWGWGVANSKKNDPHYGKGMALEKLGLSNRYYSFDRAGWHFVVLDSTHLPNNTSQYPYIGQLDDEQYEWLVTDINGIAMTRNMPICILSHIPIMAACEYFDGPNEESGNWVVPAAWMHIDARRFRDYFLQTSSVRLCLSGHTHQYEVLDYLGVRYITNGAVCGNWWDGAYMDFPPAYVMVNLYDDGTADGLFVPYEKT